MNTTIHILNETLISSIKDTDMPLGLADGKMGICIYFYILSRYEKNKEYENIAENILDEIFKNIDKITSIDARNGITGIGLGITYLIKNKYVDGKINIILKDIDDTVFKNLSYSKYYERLDTLSIIHILYYLCVRLKDQKENSEEEYLFKELIIQTINNLYERVDLRFYEEPLSYTVDYPLPQLLFVLSEIYSFSFYRQRLDKIIEKLSCKILSTIPLLHSNRLYLLWGMVSLQKYIQDRNWEKHIKLIKEQIDIEVILNSELKDKNIFFNDGYASVYILIMSLDNFFSFPLIEKYTNRIYQKIWKSSIWKRLQETKYFNAYRSLCSGFCGTILILNKIDTSQKK